MNAQLILLGDTSRPESDKQYAVKIRIWDTFSKKENLFRTAFDLKKEAFTNAQETKARKDFLLLSVNPLEGKPKLNISYL
jgi:hypothetical protein